METTKEIMEKVQPAISALEKEYVRFKLTFIIKSFVQYGYDMYFLKGLPEEIIKKKMQEIHPVTTVGWRLTYQGDQYGDFKNVSKRGATSVLPGAFSDLPNLSEVNVNYTIVGSDEILELLSLMKRQIEAVIHSPKNREE